MRAAVKAANFPASASVYTLRHSCISRQIEAGVPLTIVATNTGTSVRMIEQTYGKHLTHVRRELRERANPALRVRLGC
jgi:integrase